MNQKKPLIALLTNNDDDIYCFRKELIEAILNNGYEMLISCPYGEKLKMMEEYNYIYDNPFIDRRGTNPIADFKLFLHYKKLFSKYKPKIVLTYTAKPGVYGSIAAYFCDIPCINNVTGFGSVLNKKGILRKFIMTLFKFAYNKAACIMFQNDTNLKLAIQLGMIKGDYKLIPGSGVALDRYPVQDYPDAGNGIEGPPVVFNYIGRILKDKGVDDYIACAQYIKKKYPKTEFHMIGFIEPTESFYIDILDELQRKKIIFYHGSQTDVRPFIRRSNAIIHPSTYGEGMSNVLLENASSGRPIITTDNPGCKETVNNELSGYIYEGGNVNELIQCVERFLKIENNERKKMGLLGRQWVESRFSRAIVINSYLKKINEIICTL